MRIWNLRLNLDELNAANLSGMTDQIRSELWLGLVYGCNGLDMPEGSSKHLRSTFEIGSAWRGEALAHQEKMSLGGKASAENRKQKTGTAQPTKPRSTFEAPSEGSSNQSTIYNLQSTNQQPEKASSPSRARGPRKPKKQIHIPEEYLKDLQVICDDWPRRSKKQEGGYQDLRIWTDPADLWEAMTKNFPNDDPALMIKCGLVYLDQILPEPSEFDLRKPEPPSFCYAMMNFYGPKMAYWKLKKEAARAKMEEQK